MDLPEIRAAVGCFLSDSDLTAAALVCKSWNNSFHPILYSAIQWGYHSQPTVDVVIANADYIRHLDLFGSHDYIFPGNCTMLESLEYESRIHSSGINSLRWFSVIQESSQSRSMNKRPHHYAGPFWKRCRLAQNFVYYVSMRTSYRILLVWHSSSTSQSALSTLKFLRINAPLLDRWTSGHVSQH